MKVALAIIKASSFTAIPKLVRRAAAQQLDSGHQVWHNQDTRTPNCFMSSGGPIFWGESCENKKGNLGVLTRQLTSQECTKRMLTSDWSDIRFFVPMLWLPVNAKLSAFRLY